MEIKKISKKTVLEDIKDLLRDYTPSDFYNVYYFTFHYEDQTLKTIKRSTYNIDDIEIDLNGAVVLITTILVYKLNGDDWEYCDNVNSVMKLVDE